MTRCVLVMIVSTGCGGATAMSGGTTAADDIPRPADVRDAVAELPHFTLAAAPAPQGLKDFYALPIEAYITAEIDANYLELADRAAFRVTRDGAPVDDIAARGGDYKDGWHSRTTGTRFDVTATGEYAAELILDGAPTGMIARLSVGTVPCVGGTPRIKAYPRIAPHLEYAGLVVEGWRPRDDRGAIVVEWKHDGTVVATVPGHPQDGLIDELDRVTTDVGVWNDGIQFACGWDWVVETLDRPAKDAPIAPGAWTVRILREVGPSTEVSFEVGADGAVSGEFGARTVEDPRRQEQDVPLASRTIELDAADRTALGKVKTAKPPITPAEVRLLTRSRDALNVRLRVNTLRLNQHCGGESYADYAANQRETRGGGGSDDELRREWRDAERDARECDARADQSKRDIKAELAKQKRLIRELGGPWRDDEHPTEP